MVRLLSLDGLLDACRLAGREPAEALPLSVASAVASMAASAAS